MFKVIINDLVTPVINEVNGDVLLAPHSNYPTNLKKFNLKHPEIKTTDDLFDVLSSINYIKYLLLTTFFDKDNDISFELPYEILSSSSKERLFFGIIFYRTDTSLLTIELRDKNSNHVETRLYYTRPSLLEGNMRESSRNRSILKGVIKEGKLWDVDEEGFLSEVTDSKPTDKNKALYLVCVDNSGVHFLYESIYGKTRIWDTCVQQAGPPDMNSVDGVLIAVEDGRREFELREYDYLDGRCYGFGLRLESYKVLQKLSVIGAQDLYPDVGFLIVRVDDGKTQSDFVTTVWVDKPSFDQTNNFKEKTKEPKLKIVK